jgi:hypothetical protein
LPAARTELFLALYTAAPSDSGGGTEVSGGAYARAQFNTAQASGNWNATNERITITGHGYKDQSGPVHLTSSGTLPAGLAAATDYWVKVIDANTIELTTTKGGATAAFTDAGSGTHSIHHIQTASGAGGATDNRGTIDFPQASGANWGTITHVGIFSAKTGGTLIAHGALASSKVVNDGDLFLIPVADLDLTMA